MPKRTEMNFVPFPSSAAAASTIHSQSAFVCAENVLRANRLVGGDEDEALHPVLGGQLGEDPGAEDVVPHGFERVRLHQRDVLVGGGVEDDRRLVALEEAADLAGILDVGERRHRGRVVALALKLALDGDEGVLGVVDEDDLPRAERGDLAAEFRADRTAGSRDEHGRAGDVRGDRGHVELDGLAPEDVLDLHLAELAGEVEVAGDELVHARHGLHGHARVAARVHDPLTDLARAGRDGDDDLVRPVVVQEPREVQGRAQHPDTVEAHVLLVGLVVDEPDRRVAELRALEHLADDHLAGIARADDQRRLAATDDPTSRTLDQVRARTRAPTTIPSVNIQSMAMIPRGRFQPGTGSQR